MDSIVVRYMRREKFISGGLEGAGVEGKNRRKLTSKESHDNEDKDLVDAGFGRTGKPPVKKSSGSKIKSEDPFYTGFGESGPGRKGHCADRSVKERDGDIFSDAFGSKEMSGGRSSGSSRKSGGFEEDNSSGSGDFSGNVNIDSPAKSKKNKKSPENDPFYTGFGYTNQREDDNIRQSENEPQRREDLMESPGRTSNEVKDEINFVHNNNDIFENIIPEEETDKDAIMESFAEDIRPEKRFMTSSVFDRDVTEKPEEAKPVKSFSVSDRDDDEIPKPDKTVKRSSIFERDDDDLFSV